jgi:hypothetical protein
MSDSMTDHLFEDGLDPFSEPGAIKPDLDQARRFLDLLDPAGDFTFQVFDDSPLKGVHLAKIAHGTLDEEAERLSTWNAAGAGVFVTIGETDGMGRRAENVIRVRAVFVDLDGAPLQPVLACALKPHVIVESSPGRYHGYWLVDDLPLDQFAPVQKAIAARFGGDPAVHDLPRVMRLPGFWHQKAQPFMTRVHRREDRLPYTADEILACFPHRVEPGKGAGNGQDRGHTAGGTDDLVRLILTGEAYHQPLTALAWRYVADGMIPAKVVQTLQGLMSASSGPRDDRWCARYAEIPRTVATAEQKLAAQGGVTTSAPIASAVEEEWPEPDLSVLEEHRLPAPELPLEIFGDYWSSWVSAQAEAKSCAPDYVAAGLLAGAGVLIGNARWGSPWPGWAEPPVLWVAGVGNPSSGKSPGLDGPRDLLTAIEAEANSGRKEELLQWDTAARAAKLHLEVWEAEAKVAIRSDSPPPPRPAEAEPPERPVMCRIVTDDPTIERFARLISENCKGMLLYRDELSGWIGSHDRYGGAGGDRPFYLQAYGGRPYVVDRQKNPEPIIIPALTIGICGGIQPDRLRSQVLSGDDDGLAARFLYFWPEPVPPRRPTRLPPSGAQTKLELLHSLKEQLGADGKRVPLPFASAAADALQEYRTQVAELESEASGLFLSWIGKLPGTVVRVATILEHLYWVGDREGGMPPQEISDRAAVAAIAFLDSYALPMARRAFGDAGQPLADRDAVAIARWIMAQTPIPEAINLPDLRRHHAPIGRDAERYDAAFSELADVNWVRPTQPVGGGLPGRRRKDWSVNPRLQEAQP